MRKIFFATATLPITATKTINTGLLVTIILIMMTTLGCKKDAGSPSQNSLEINKVISSDWFI